MKISARSLAKQVRDGEISAKQVIEETLELIKAKDPDINAFNFVAADQALRRAEEIDLLVANGQDPGPLAGVPVALKDNICTRGIPTTCSSRILKGWLPPYDATVVSRLLDAGAVPIGKTNMDEFAMGSSTETSAFGPTRNPRDLSRVPGGSSGGSAAAVAAGMTPLALGSDTGGSVRQPAALCGVVGVKPTYGRVSRYGLVAFASSLDQIGPFAANVADAALLLDVISGYDPLDSTSMPEGHSFYAPRRDSFGRLKLRPVRGMEPNSLLPATKRTPEGMRVGLVSELLGDGVSPDVTERVYAAAEALEAAGAHVREVSIPALSYALSAYYLIAQAEASSNLARYDGVRYGLRLDTENVERMNAETRSAGFGAEVKRRIILGTFALSAGYYDDYYVKAQKVRTLVKQGFTAAYGQNSPLPDCDVLLAPTSPSVAFRLGERLDDPLQMYLSDVCTVPSNLSGQPAISLPFGTGADGLPVGVQILAPALREDEMFRAAAALEASTDAGPIHSSIDAGGSRPSVNDSPKAVSVDPNGLQALDVLVEEWEIVVGLEVHAELKTQTKLFSWSLNSFADEPNTNIDPVCLGLPGTLPVLNRQAVDLAIRACVSLGSEIHSSEFSRKNYFYPDMPKNYQISQYDQPIGVGGALELPSGKVVGIVRAHLEEDTGKSTHRGGSGRIEGAEYSLIDYNRAGVPLLEIVSCPDIRSSSEAREYVIELRDILVAVGASDGKMEEGSLRVDANVSVRRKGDPGLGTRCEIKNMNSLRSLVRAIDYEAGRQIQLLSAGQPVPLETRHWDEVSARTSTLRTKEEETDYRYFPEPDLVWLHPDPAWVGQIRSWVEGIDSGMPLLPRRRREHLAAATGRDTSDIALFVTRGQDRLALATIAAGADPGAVLKHLEQNLAAGAGKITPEAFAELIRMESDGELTSNQVKTTLAEMALSGDGPREVAAALGFESVTASRLADVLTGVLTENPEEWTRFREGDEAERKRLQGFFIGQVMRLTKGQADGRMVAKVLKSLADN